MANATMTPPSLKGQMAAKYRQAWRWERVPPGLDARLYDAFNAALRLIERLPEWRSRIEADITLNAHGQAREMRALMKGNRADLIIGAVRLVEAGRSWLLIVRPSRRRSSTVPTLSPPSNARR